MAASAALSATAMSASSPEVTPAWRGTSPSGQEVRIVVGPPPGSEFSHLAWPKAVKTAAGTIVLGYQIGVRHGAGSSPAVSVSTDNGRTFGQPHVLQRFGPEQEYTNSGNMAMGLAHDGSVVVLSHGMRGNQANHIFGWRSTDEGRTWLEVDTSRLGPNKTGSATGTIVRLPGTSLMVVGHYREPSQPHSTGIWAAVSPDDGLSWGEPQTISNVDGGEPLLVRDGERLLVFVRGRGPASVRQYIVISNDLGKTWHTELSNIVALNEKTTVITHPFAMVNPNKSDEIVAVTFERPLPARADLWRSRTVERSGQSIEFRHERKLLDLPVVPGSQANDFGYPWLVPLEGKRWLMFFYHGERVGRCYIWATEIEL